MPEKVRNIEFDALCYRPKSLGPVSESVREFFGRIFRTFRSFESEAELMEALERDEGTALLIIDGHACGDDTPLRESLGRIMARPVPPPLLWLYDRGKEAELGALVALGVHDALPVPWSREAVRIHLKSLIGILQVQRREKRLQKELLSCRSRDPQTGEECSELRKRCENLEGFFLRESGELKELSDGLTSLSTLMLQTELSEKQKKYMGNLHKLVAHFSRLARDLKSHTEMLFRGSGTQESQLRNFNINTLFDLLADYSERKIGGQELELVFDVDNTVPAQLYGDPILLGQVLQNLLGVMIDLDGEGDIVLRAALSPVPGREKEKILHLELLDKARGQLVDDASFREHLAANGEVRQAKRWIEAMGGRFDAPKEGEGTLLRFSVPVRQEERRSYRLPSSDWMNKRILILAGNPSVAEALKRMLGYFHFPLTVARNGEEAVEQLDRQSFDVVFVDPDDFSEREFIQNIIAKKHDAKLVTLSEDPVRDEKALGDLVLYIDAFLGKPFTQEKIFDVILDLFARDRLEGTQESLSILKENLALLVGKKKILYIGERDTDWLMLKGMVEDTEIELTQTEDLQQLSMYLISADMVLVSGHLSDTQWKAVLENCQKHCTDKDIVILLGESETVRKKEARENGIRHLIPTPIDPEYFYRLLLDIFLS